MQPHRETVLLIITQLNAVEEAQGTIVLVRALANERYIVGVPK